MLRFIFSLFWSPLLARVKLRWISVKGRWAISVTRFAASSSTTSSGTDAISPWLIASVTCWENGSGGLFPITATYHRLLLGGALDMLSGQFWISRYTEKSAMPDLSRTIDWIVSYGAWDASRLSKREDRRNGIASRSTLGGLSGVLGIGAEHSIGI